jgi:hypothetical protein
LSQTSQISENQYIAKSKINSRKIAHNQNKLSVTKPAN